MITKTNAHTKVTEGLTKRQTGAANAGEGSITKFKWKAEVQLELGSVGRKQKADRREERGENCECV